MLRCIARLLKQILLQIAVVGPRNDNLAHAAFLGRNAGLCATSWVRLPKGRNFSRRDVFRIALWLRAARTAVSAPAAANASIARVIVGASARMAGRVVSVPARLYDLGGHLRVGERLRVGDTGPNVESRQREDHCENENAGRAVSLVQRQTAPPFPLGSLVGVLPSPAHDADYRREMPRPSTRGKMSTRPMSAFDP